ncbi:hypothetical protein MRX96_023415 [Rhipicephalus microplus]
MSDDDIRATRVNRPTSPARNGVERQRIQRWSGVRAASFRVNEAIQAKPERGTCVQKVRVANTLLIHLHAQRAELRERAALLKRQPTAAANMHYNRSIAAGAATIAAAAVRFIHCRLCCSGHCRCNEAFFIRGARARSIILPADEGADVST